MKAKEIKQKGKGRKKVVGWIIAASIVAILGVGFAIMWSSLMKEHAEAQSVPLDAVDFGRLQDGTYTGDYAGGMYKWRTSEVEVTVSSGKVSKIKLLKTVDPARSNVQQDVLFDRVVQAQSLKVDTLSTATLTSKAWLKAVENALLKAESN